MYHVNVPNIHLSTYNGMNKFNNIPPDIQRLNIVCKNTPVLNENLLPYYTFIENLLPL